MDNKNEKITLLSNSTVEDKNQKIEGDLIEIIFDKSEIISLEVLENGSIFSKNFGMKKIIVTKINLLKIKIYLLVILLV